MKKIPFNITFFLLVPVLFGFNKNVNNGHVANRAPEKMITVVVTIPESCINSLKCSCSSPGTANPIAIGGGGRSNPKGHEVLTYLYYQSLDPQEKQQFKNNNRDMAVLSDPQKQREIESLLGGEVPTYEKMEAAKKEINTSLNDLQSTIQDNITDKQKQQLLLKKMEEVRKTTNKNSGFHP